MCIVNVFWVLFWYRPVDGTTRLFLWSLMILMSLTSPLSPPFFWTGEVEFVQKSGIIDQTTTSFFDFNSFEGLNHKMSVSGPVEMLRDLKQCFALHPHSW